MKKSKFTETQIAQILKEPDAGMLVNAMVGSAREVGLSAGRVRFERIGWSTLPGETATVQAADPLPADIWNQSNT
jgi:hypothetical protein